MTKSLYKQYKDYILFGREDQKVGVDFLSNFVELFRETRNTTIF